MRLANNRYRGVNVFLLFACVVFWGCNLAWSQAAEKALPDAPKQATAEKKNFFARWAEFYRQDWSGSALRRRLPRPLRRGVALRLHWIRRRFQTPTGRTVARR